MGRVDEALRRAAETAAREEGVPDAPLKPAGLADDIDTLAREAFPIEMDEHRKGPRPAPAAKPASATVAAAVAPVAVPIAPVAPIALSAAVVQPEPVPQVHPELPSRAAVREPQPHGAPAINLPSPRSVFERIDSSLVGKIVIDAEIAPASREQYRRMAATLHHSQASHGLKVVMVSSAVMGEGKTLTSSNLALTLSESYKKNVLLIDGDLRRPALHSLFRLESSPGLSEGLFAGEDQRLAVRQVSPRLGVLTAGRPSADPIAGLTSPRMASVIEEARDAFDWVIIDTPPVALLPDANLLATMVDGAILVVRSGSTPWDLAQRAVDAIGRERVLGVVLNLSNAPSHNLGYGYYDYVAEAGTKITPTSQ